MADGNLANFEPFDPTADPAMVFDRFEEFIAAFHYRYMSITKEPPAEHATEPQQKAWHQQNKKKILLGKFASRSLQRDFEDCVTAEERDTVTFDAVVEWMKD